MSDAVSEDSPTPPTPVSLSPTPLVTRQTVLPRLADVLPDFDGLTVQYPNYGYYVAGERTGPVGFTPAPSPVTGPRQFPGSSPPQTLQLVHRHSKIPAYPTPAPSPFLANSEVPAGGQRVPGYPPVPAVTARDRRAERPPSPQTVRKVRKSPRKDKPHYNIKYTKEQHDFIVYAFVDLNKTWKVVEDMYAEQFPSSELVRGPQGLQAMFYRLNKAIPMADRDGLLLFKPDFTVATMEVPVRHQRDNKIGLLDRAPERARNYGWVSDEHKRGIWGIGKYMSPPLPFLAPLGLTEVDLSNSYCATSPTRRQPTQERSIHQAPAGVLRCKIAETHLISGWSSFCAGLSRHRPSCGRVYICFLLL